MNIDQWWPDLYFAPVNLWTLMPADMFYATPEEQWEMVWCEHTKKYIPITRDMVINNPVVQHMSELIALR